MAFDKVIYNQKSKSVLEDKIRLPLYFYEARKNTHWHCFCQAAENHTKKYTPSMTDTIVDWASTHRRAFLKFTIAVLTSVSVESAKGHQQKEQERQLRVMNVALRSIIRHRKNHTGQHCLQLRIHVDSLIEVLQFHLDSLVAQVLIVHRLAIISPHLSTCKFQKDKKV